MPFFLQNNSNEENDPEKGREIVASLDKKVETLLKKSSSRSNIDDDQPTSSPKFFRSHKRNKKFYNSINHDNVDELPSVPKNNLGDEAFVNLDPDDSGDGTHQKRASSSSPRRSPVFGSDGNSIPPSSPTLKDRILENFKDLYFYSIIIFTCIFAILAGLSGIEIYNKNLKEENLNKKPSNIFERNLFYTQSAEEENNLYLLNLRDTCFFSIGIAIGIILHTVSDFVQKKRILRKYNFVINIGIILVLIIFIGAYIMNKVEIARETLETTKGGNSKAHKQILTEIFNSVDGIVLVFTGITFGVILFLIIQYILDLFLAFEPRRILQIKSFISSCFAVSTAVAAAFIYFNITDEEPPLDWSVILLISFIGGIGGILAVMKFSFDDISSGSAEE